MYTVGLRKSKGPEAAKAFIAGLEVGRENHLYTTLILAEELKGLSKAVDGVDKILAATDRAKVLTKEINSFTSALAENMGSGGKHDMVMKEEQNQHAGDGAVGPEQPGQPSGTQ